MRSALTSVSTIAAFAFVTMLARTISTSAISEATAMTNVIVHGNARLRNGWLARFRLVTDTLGKLPNCELLVSVRLPGFSPDMKRIHASAEHTQPRLRPNLRRAAHPFTRT